MSSDIGQNLLSQLFLKRHELEQLSRQLIKPGKTTFFSEEVKHFEGKVKVSEGQKVTFPLDTKRDVIDAIEIYTIPQKSADQERAQLEIKVYDEATGRLHWIGQVYHDDNLLLQGLSIQAHNIYRPSVQLEVLSGSPIELSGMGDYTNSNPDDISAFINYRLVAADGCGFVNTNGYVEFSNYRLLPPDSFSTKNDKHTVSVKDFFPENTFGVRLSYELGQGMDHIVDLSIGEMKLGLQVRAAQMKGSQVTIQKDFDPVDKKLDMKLRIETDQEVVVSDLKLHFLRRSSNRPLNIIGLKSLGDLGAGMLDAMRSSPSETTPRVGLICSINRSEDVQNLIQNIDRQNYRNKACIIVLNSNELQKSDFAALECPSVFVRVDETLSLGHCLNAGVAAGLSETCEYFAKIDADDWYGAAYIADAVNICNQFGSKVLCKKSCFMSLAHLNETRIKNPNTTYELVDRGAGGTIFFSEDVAKTVPFKEGLRYGTDFEFFNSLILNNCPVLGVDPFNYLYRRNEAGHTWNASDETLISGSILIGPSSLSTQVANY